MNCQQALELLSRRDLPPHERQPLVDHMAACGECRRAAADEPLLEAVFALRPDAPVPFGFADRVMARVRVEAGSDWVPTANWRRWTLRLAPVAAALAIGALLTPVEVVERATLEEMTETLTIGAGQTDAPVALLLSGSDVGGEELLEAALTGQVESTGDETR